MKKGNLYVVATPIGNLADITFRAIETLKSVDIIACEDTRQTKKLVSKYEITTSLVSYHQHSTIQKIEQLLKNLEDGKDIAVVTDAGTPGISDPGNVLVKKAHECKINVVAIPGPSALTTALSVSGFPTDRFIFYGFLPHKKGKQTVLKEISQNKFTSVFFESTHRILKSLQQLSEHLEDDREIFVARELTKKFESLYRGSVSEVLEELKNDTVKGEFVVIVSGVRHK